MHEKQRKEKSGAHQECFGVQGGYRKKVPEVKKTDEWG